MKHCEYSTKLLDKLRRLDSKNQLDFALIENAIFWAQKYHAGQMRKSGEPFYSHPLAVAGMISDYLLKTDVIVASILHDIVEDTEVTGGMILHEFGQRIEEMVDRLTRDKPDGRKLSVEEILNDAYHAKDKDVILIKCCDRLHNLQTITAKDPAKLEKKVHETLNCFIIAAMHLQHKSIEELIHQACCDILSIRDLSHDLPQFTKQDSYLACLKNTDTHQLVSQVFQNATNQVRS